MKVDVNEDVVARKTQKMKKRKEERNVNRGRIAANEDEVRRRCKYCDKDIGKMLDVVLTALSACYCSVIESRIHVLICIDAAMHPLRMDLAVGFVCAF